MITSGFGTTFDLERGTTRRWVMRDGVKRWADDGTLVQPQRAAQKRNLPFSSYEAEKRAWIEAHPDATPEQYEQAMRAIADRLWL